MCTLALTLGEVSKKWFEKSGGEIRKGMVLVDPKCKPIASWTFLAEIWSINGEKVTVKNNYSPVLNIAHIR
jgi:hypothetical protein